MCRRMQQIAPLLTHCEIKLISTGIGVDEGMMYSKQPNAGKSTSCKDITVALSELQHGFSQVFLTAPPALQTVRGYRKYRSQLV